MTWLVEEEREKKENRERNGKDRKRIRKRERKRRRSLKLRTSQRLARLWEVSSRSLRVHSCSAQTEERQRRKRKRERKGRDRRKEKGKNGAWVSTEIIEQKGKAISKYKRINQHSILETVKKSFKNQKQFSNT